MLELFAKRLLEQKDYASALKASYYYYAGGNFRKAEEAAATAYELYEAAGKSRSAKDNFLRRMRAVKLNSKLVAKLLKGLKPETSEFQQAALRHRLENAMTDWLISKKTKSLIAGFFSHHEADFNHALLSRQVCVDFERAIKRHAAGALEAAGLQGASVNVSADHLPDAGYTGTVVVKHERPYLHDKLVGHYESHPPAGARLKSHAYTNGESWLTLAPAGDARRVGGQKPQLSRRK